MSSTAAVPRTSSIPANEGECEHEMNPAWCAICKHRQATSDRPLVRIQLQQDGLFCSGCGALMHKGDTITQEGRSKRCTLCS